MKQLAFVVVAALIVTLAISACRKTGPFVGKTLNECHFTGDNADLFAKALQERMVDQGATFSKDMGIEIKGSILWSTDRIDSSYYAQIPIFGMIISVDTSWVIVRELGSANIKFPSQYPYELALESANPIIEAICEHFEPLPHSPGVSNEACVRVGRIHEDLPLVPIPPLPGAPH